MPVGKIKYDIIRCCLGNITVICECAHIRGPDNVATPGAYPVGGVGGACPPGCPRGRQKRKGEKKKKKKEEKERKKRKKGKGKEKEKKKEEGVRKSEKGEKSEKLRPYPGSRARAKCQT